MSESGAEITGPDLHEIVRVGEPVPALVIEVPELSVRVHRAIANMVLVFGISVGVIGMVWKWFELPLWWLFAVLGLLVVGALIWIVRWKKPVEGVAGVGDLTLVPMPIRIRRWIGVVVAMTVSFWSSIDLSMPRPIVVLDLIVLCGLGVAVLLIPRFVRTVGPISCAKCYYDMTGAVLPDSCPECGKLIGGSAWLTWKVPYRAGWIGLVGWSMIALGAAGLVVVSIV